jgi:hypothetical protein
MLRAFLFLSAFCVAATSTLAEQLPPPQNPAADRPKTPPQGPALIPPQNAPQQPPAAQPANKKVGKPPEFFAARRQAQIDRKQAQIERMKEFKAARAAADEKLYQDWHERYLADTPVRVEYYRALAAAYQSQPALPYYGGPYFYAAGPAVILPVVYAPVIYNPIYQPPVYGTFIPWSW